MNTTTKWIAGFWSCILFISILACGHGDDGHSEPIDDETDAFTRIDTSGPQCGGSLNCSDFSSCDEALNQLNACDGDPHGLDNDGDGLPCESSVCEVQCTVDQNCSDFNSCSDAVDHLQQCDGDPHGIDNDGNGVPCESTLCDVQCQVDRNCGTFNSCDEAQKHQDYCNGFHQLDKDNDGVACEASDCNIDCSASWDTYNCSNQGMTCKRANRILDACQGDKFRLDGDGNGTPCESLCTQ